MLHEPRLILSRDSSACRISGSFNLINDRRLSLPNQPISKIFGRVDADECTFDETVRVVIFCPVHLAHHSIAQVQHRVVQVLGVSENASSAANQTEVALRRRELELQVEQILV